MATLKEILDTRADVEKRFIKDYKKLSDIVEGSKAMGFKVVLTQGVYDLLHEGHALYLEKAREHGDLLIVGVDSDELTRQRKGPDRPIVPLEERMKMLAHLRHVDIITVRNEGDGIGDLIRAVKPNVLVVSKSTKDFTKKMKEEYKDVCDRIVDLPPQATTSTTARIRQVAIEGANQLAKEVKALTDDFIKRFKL